MSYLVYCISRSFVVHPPALTGVERKSVRYLESGGLLAAFSEVDAGLKPTLPTIIDYDTVVEALFSRTPIIPMRFGNYFPSLETLGRFLTKNRRKLVQLLEILEGSAEMGIRVLSTREPAGVPSSENQIPDVPGTAVKGRQYLSRRKTRYQADTMLSGKGDEIDALLRATLDGLYSRVKSEVASKAPATRFAEGKGHEPLELFLSVYFLVSMNLIDDFRLKFSAIKFPGAKFLLSGPWPPYTFAEFAVRNDNS